MTPERLRFLRKWHQTGKRVDWMRTLLHRSVGRPRPLVHGTRDEHRELLTHYLSEARR